MSEQCVGTTRVGRAGRIGVALVAVVMASVVGLLVLRRRS